MHQHRPDVRQGGLGDSHVRLVWGLGWVGTIRGYCAGIEGSGSSEEGTQRAWWGWSTMLRSCISTQLLPQLLQTITNPHGSIGHQVVLTDVKLQACKAPGNFWATPLGCCIASNGHKLEAGHHRVRHAAVCCLRGVHHKGGVLAGLLKALLGVST